MLLPSKIAVKFRTFYSPPILLVKILGRVVKYLSQLFVSDLGRQREQLLCVAAGRMGNSAGDGDGVLDLSMKKSLDVIIADSTAHSVLHDATHVVCAPSSSSLNTLSVTAATTGSQQLPGVSLVQLPASDCDGSSDVHRTDGPVSRTTSLASAAAAALLSASAVRTNSRFQLSFSPLLSHSGARVHPGATETAVRYSSSCDLFAPPYTTSSAPHTALMSPLMTGSCYVRATAGCSTRPRLKRRRQNSDEATCTRSETTFQLPLTDSDTSRQSPNMNDRQLSVTTSEPEMRPQSSDDVSDDAGYIERRRKNNEAAKRSRDARRQKEQQTATRAAALEYDNVQLRAELAALRDQAAKLHSILYNKLGV